MILYHGSNVEVKYPKIVIDDVGRDFGFAFYLTPIKEQAEKMALRKVKIKNTGMPIVSVFEWNKDITKYKYKKFENADNEWIDLIIKCRSNTKYKHQFDIVEGKIADDKVGITISLVIEGLLSIENALEKLKYQKINSQIAFCSDKALESIKFIKSYKVQQ